LRSDVIVPISRRVSVLGGVSGGTVVGDSIPVHYQFYLGGQGTLALRGLMPFVGMDFMQEACHHLLIANMHLQWEMWNDNFLILKANAAKAEDDRKQMLKPGNIALGYGAAFGYRSPIGPMEFNVMTSNRNQLLWFVNIGYWF
jgi:NTE family protein